MSSLQPGIAGDGSDSLRPTAKPPRPYGISRSEGCGTSVREYLPILTMIILVVLFAALSFAASKLLGPRRPTSAKEAPYECGIVPESGTAERFPVKFYLVAIAFIVLDVEIIFLYPFTTIFRQFAPPAYGLVIMGVFLLVLLVPFAYLLSTVPDRESAQVVAQRIARRSDRPFDFEGQTLQIGASVGLAIGPDDGDEPEVLLELADRDMCAAKGRKTVAAQAPSATAPARSAR